MIKLNEVCFKYRNSKDISLDNINIEIKKGEFILICGSSGSGKTSITRLINKLIPYYYEGDLNGDVKINEKSLSDYQMFELSKNCLLYTSPSPRDVEESRMPSSA